MIKKKEKLMTTTTVQIQGSKGPVHAIIECVLTDNDTNESYIRGLGKLYDETKAKRKKILSNGGKSAPDEIARVDAAAKTELLKYQKILDSLEDTVRSIRSCLRAINPLNVTCSWREKSEIGCKEQRRRKWAPNT